MDGSMGLTFQILNYGRIYGANLSDPELWTIYGANLSDPEQ